MRWSTISANSWLIELQRVWVIEREFLNSKNSKRKTPWAVSTWG